MSENTPETVGEPEPKRALWYSNAVKLVSMTQGFNGETIEQLIGLVARVSSPKSDEDKKKDVMNLLHYCMEHKHWSVFEMVDVTFLIHTTRALAPQFIRHRSFNFMEFSQRYSSPTEFSFGEARLQDSTNRQSSLETDDEYLKWWFTQQQIKIQEAAQEAYEQAISRGIAKECARGLLPLNTSTRFYMKGSLRSWIHYCQLRTSPETQKEHRAIAQDIADILVAQMPFLKPFLKQQ